MKKLIKRADGSKSPRGLWDNIRANKGSGKKPTKEMLKQEAKIKKEEDMNMEYKKGGKKNSAKAKVMKEAKREKESFITESKELSFGNKPKKKEMEMEEKEEMKKGGKKTMEPGGGGRFAKMVSKMKKEGKSEDSAKAIAASIGRKKYGKSKFQEMAAAGKKKMGGKKC
jgi:hypothetical protein